MKAGVNFKDFFSNTSADYDLAKWDIEQSVKIDGVPQIEKYDCGVACKQTVDGYFGVKSKLDYSLLREYAAVSGGIDSKYIMTIYDNNGYTTTPLGNGFNQSYSHEKVLPFIQETLKNKNLVHFAFKNSAGNHFGVAYKVKYLSDFSRFKISIWDPANDGFTRTVTQKTFRSIGLFGVFGISK
jgi:hypothetical protein